MPALGLACGGGGSRGARADRGPAIVATARRPLATVNGSVPGIALSLFSLRRSGPKVVTAKLRVSADATAKTSSLTGRVPLALGEDVLDETVDGMRLIDEVNGREHFPLKDAEDDCLCSTFEALRAGTSADIYAKFPAPPPGVTRVALHVPTFTSFDGVRIDP